MAQSSPLLDIATRLKRARERKGLTQRALAEKVGLPQGHISRIERAEVDLQTSNLLELARALDLELALVPRQALAAIDGLVHGHSARSVAVPAAYSLDGEGDEGDQDHGGHDELSP